jgi:hypothetical protein
VLIEWFLPVGAHLEKAAACYGRAPAGATYV